MKRIAAVLGLAFAAAWLARPAHAIPEFPKDVLAGCPELTINSPVALPQAVGILQVCLDQRYAQRQYAVKVRAGRFAVPACPPAAPGAFTCHAMVEVEGLIVSVDGGILTGDSVLMDLRYSLDQRKGMVLGWHATLDSHGAKLNP